MKAFRTIRLHPTGEWSLRCVCNRRILTGTVRFRAYEMNRRETKAMRAELGGISSLFITGGRR
jgi:hypothetical protein